MQKLPSRGRSGILPWIGVFTSMAAGGCCPLARWLCGPDTSPWVQAAYDTPKAALRTFLESARRDDAAVAYRSMSADYKQRLKQKHGLSGSVEAAVAWQRMKQDTPLHMLGYATFGEPEQSRSGATWIIDVEGYRFRVDVVRQPYWAVYFLGADGIVLERGDFVPSLISLARIESDAEQERSRLRLDPPLEFDHEGLESVPLDRLVRAEIGHEWKIDRIEQVER